MRALLANPIYRGERVWNRSLWVKDHDTGRRRRIERPEGEWVRQTEESWRIVPDDLWAAVQDARAGRNERHERDAGGRIRRSAARCGTIRKRLLAGLRRVRGQLPRARRARLGLLLAPQPRELRERADSGRVAGRLRGVGCLAPGATRRKAYGPASHSLRRSRFARARSVLASSGSRWP
jgi:hypothetical protein